jgi:hypothetical protein
MGQSSGLWNKSVRRYCVWRTDFGPWNALDVSRSYLMFLQAQEV